METREIFLQKINEFILFSNKLPDKDAIKSKYLDLVKEYHPDVNNEIDGTILNEYMVIINNIFEKIMNDKIKHSKHKSTGNNIQGFNFTVFCQLLTKITEIGINNETISDGVFCEYKNLLLLEIKKFDKSAEEAFELLLSGELIIGDAYKIKLLNSGIANYVYLLNSVPISTKEKYKRMTDIHITNMQLGKIADNYLLEYKDSCGDEEYKKAVEKVIQWLKEIVKKYKN